MKKDIVKNKLIVSLIFLVIVLSIFFYVYTTTLKNHRKSEENLIKWQEVYYHQQEVEALSSSIALIEEDKNSLDVHFAKSSNVVLFLDYLESLAKKIDIETEVSLVDVPQKEEGLIVEMNIKGEFKTIYKFLKLLENSPYQLEFISVDINNSTNEETLEKENKKIKWQAQLRIKLLSFLK